MQVFVTLDRNRLPYSVEYQTYDFLLPLYYHLYVEEAYNSEAYMYFIILKQVEKPIIRYRPRIDYP